MQPFRIEPVAPAHTYMTYELRSPRQTHARPATCLEVECTAFLRGWVTRVDPSTRLGREQLNYIRLHSGRTYADITPPDATIVSLSFPAGQKCFSEHRVTVDREPLYIVRGGDARENTGLIRRHIRGEEWVEDFAEHQQSIADIVQRG